MGAFLILIGIFIVLLFFLINTYRKGKELKYIYLLIPLGLLVIIYVLSQLFFKEYSGDLFNSCYGSVFDQLGLELGLDFITYFNWFGGLMVLFALLHLPYAIYLKIKKKEGVSLVIARMILLFIIAFIIVIVFNFFTVSTICL